MNNNLTNKDGKWIFPKFEMPELWYKDDEIYNLMQSFKRPRNIDPTSYDFKINFWSNLLMKYAYHHHVLIINENQMQSIFTKDFKSNGISLKLQCTNTILRSMELDGKLVEISSFEGGSLIGKLISGVGWVLKAPLSWTFKKISSAFYFTEDSSSQDHVKLSGEMVIVEVVHDCLTEFMEWVVNHTDMHISPHLDVITLEDFNQLLSSYFPHKTSRNLAQQILINRKQIEIIALSQPSLIKIADQPIGPVTVVKFSRAADLPISSRGLVKRAVDQINGLVQLRALARKLEADEMVIEEKIENIKSLVRISLRAGRREEAKNHLKRGKLTEKALERKRMQLQNVENMLIEIEASSDNMEVLAALSNAVGTLKSRPMNLDNVQDLMAEVGDALAEHDEINASIGAIGDINFNDPTGSNLEEELLDLLNDGQPTLEPLPVLPNVPNFSPSSSKIENATRIARSE